MSAGQVIYRQGDPSDSFYIVRCWQVILLCQSIETDGNVPPCIVQVINGRLRSIGEKSGGGVQILGEYGQGESVGELDCITATSRPSTLHAIRDSELARMPMTLFNAISVRHPLVTIQISRIIASRVRQQMDARSSIPQSLGYSGTTDMGRNNFNLKVCVLLRHLDLGIA